MSIGVIEKGDTLYKQRRLRVLAMQATVLVISALIALFFFLNYLRNKTVPLPDITEATSGQISPPEYLYTIDGGIGADMLRRPLGLDISPDGDLFVTDSDNARITAFTLSGSRLLSFRTTSAGKSLLIPVYVAVSPKNEVYVTDRGARNVAVFSAQGKFLRYLYPNGNPDAKWLPVAIAFDKDGNVYVSDIAYDHRVLKMKEDGTILMSLGLLSEVDKSTQDIGKLAYPNGITIDDDGNIIIADSNNRRVQIFSSVGKLMKVIITGGMPRGVAVDSRGRLFIIDTFGHNILVYSAKGENIGTFGERGRNFGQLQYPNDLVIGPGNRIFVSDRENNRVSVWGERSELPAGVKPLASALIKWGWLGLPPLLAFALYRKRNIWVGSPAFVSRLMEDGLLEEAAAKLGNIYVTPEAYKSFFGRRVGNVDLSTFLRSKEYYEDLVAEYMTHFGLPEEAARMLSSLKRGMNKKTLLVGDARPTPVLEQLGIRYIPYSDFVKKVLGR